MQHSYRFSLLIHAHIPSDLALNYAQRHQLGQQTYVCSYFQRLVDSNGKSASGSPSVAPLITIISKGRQSLRRSQLKTSTDWLHICRGTPPGKQKTITATSCLLLERHRVLMWICFCCSEFPLASAHPLWTWVCSQGWQKCLILKDTVKFQDKIAMWTVKCCQIEVFGLNFSVVGHHLTAFIDANQSCEWLYFGGLDLRTPIQASRN